MQPRPIVGREWHLSVLRDAFAAVKDGGSRLVTVSGTAGIGKTSLVEAALNECSSGEFVLHFTNFYSDTPGNAFRAFPAVIRGLTQAEEIEDPLEAGRFREGVSPSTEIREAGRTGLFQKALDALSSACREKPHILVFEDVHDIDGTSESLIRYLCRGLTRSRAAIVLTHRPGIARRNPHAVHLLEEIRGLSTAIDLSLDPLTHSEVAALVSMTLPPGASELDSEWLHQRTGGNPFYLRAFLDRWAASSDEKRPDLREIPDSVVHFVRRQLAKLDESVHELIRVAAIAGPQIGYRLLIRCCSDSETALDQIDAAKEAHVLTEPSPGELSFVHALVRESVLLSLSTQDRVGMHLKVARLLEEEDASPRSSASIAQHYHGAIPVVGVEPFIHHAILAARSSNATLSFEDAIDVAELALSLPLGFVEEAELRLQRGQARLALRNVDGGVEDLHRVFEIFRQQGRHALALDAAKIALVVHPVTPEVADLAASALEIAVDDRDVARFSVPYALASYHADFDGEKSIGRLRRAVAVLQEENDSVHLANAKVALAQVLFCESHMSESLVVCSEVIDSHSSMRPVSRVRALHLAAINELWNGSIAQALRHAERALRLAERIEHSSLRADALAAIEQLYFLRAQLAESVAINDRCRALPDCPGDNRTAELRASIQLDRLETAGKLFDRLLETSDLWSHGAYLLDAMLIADAGLRTANEELLRWASRVAAQQLLTVAAPLHRCAAWYTTVVCCVGLGTLESIPDAPPGVRMPKGFDLRLRPLLALRTKDRGLIQDEFASSYQELKLHDRLIDAAWLSYEQACFAPPLRNVEAAALFERAIEDAEIHRLPLMLRLATERQEALAGPTTGPPRKQPSKRELEVLSLLATGAKNSDISRTLFISEHTVANHVRSLLRKTGLHNRTELAHFAIHRGRRGSGK